MKRSILLGALLTLLSVNIVFGQNNNEREYWQQQRKKVMEERGQPTGTDAEGLIIPEELSPDNTAKQDAKLKEMLKQGYKIPLDYGDLAARKLDGSLIAIAFVTNSYISEAGSSVYSGEFTQFNFPTGSKLLPANSPKFAALSKLAADFDGIKYDVTKENERRMFKINLLRLVNPKTKAVLEEIAAAYKNKFDRPLRVTSAIRSIEYQVELNKTNANSFKALANTFPPHTSGCAFDLSYKQMTAEEQNFLMGKLAEMERKGILDALRESGDNAALHIFVYSD